MTKIGPEAYQQPNEVLASLFDRDPQRGFPTCAAQRPSVSIRIRASTRLRTQEIGGAGTRGEEARRDRDAR